MICRDCGAEFDDSLIKCPFCEAENVQESYRRQNAYVYDLKKKSEFLAVLPEGIVKVLEKIMKHIAVLAVGVFLLVVFFSFLGTKIYSSTAVWRMERNIAKLETLYEAREYMKLEEAFRDMEDTYGGSFEKYARTIAMYSRTERIMYDMENLSSDYVKLVEVEGVSTMLESIMFVLHSIEQMEVEGFPYDEERAMLEFRKKLLDAIEIHIPLEKEEFQIAYDKYLMDEEIDYTKEATLILERVIGEQ